MSNQYASTNKRYFERLTLNQRIQHVIMMTSFFLLVATGLPVLFHQASASPAVIAFFGGFAMRSALHRVGAITLIGVCIYHVFHALFTRRGHEDFMAFMPNWKDLLDAIGMMKFYFGFSRNTPRFDRYNFIEKFEYLALGWGSVVMIITGFILWFEEQAMLVLPKWALDVAAVVHGYEAMLAFLAIIVWHFYHVHFKPGVFPMSRIWLDGKISEHEMKEDHPIEHERIIRKTLAANEPVETGAER